MVPGILYKRTSGISCKRVPQIDTLVLGCTHYPLLINIISEFVPDHIEILEQGHIIAEKLIDYLHRHPEIEKRLSKNQKLTFETTEAADNFVEKAALFMGSPVVASNIHL